MMRFYKHLVHPEENILRICRELVRTLQVPITAHTLRQELEVHPDYPSMLSMSDVLAAHSVANASVKLPADRLSELETPFVALVKDKNGNRQYDLIRSLDDRRVRSLILGENELDSFIKQHYQDIVLLTEVHTGAGERGYAQKRQQERFRNLALDAALLIVPITVCAVSLYYLFGQGLSMLFPSAYSFLTLVGWVVGSLLLWYEIDSGNAALREVCGGNSMQQGSCDAVLKSKGASIMGLSWSEIGFSFFTAVLFGQLMMGFAAPPVLAVLFLLSSIAVLYVPFSLIYQAGVAKQWCPLCLTVQGVLTAQFAVSLWAGWYRHIPLLTTAWSAVVTVLLLGLLVLLLVHQLVPIIKKNRSLVIENKQLTKFKYNAQTFDLMLQQEKAIDPDSLHGLGITIGDPQARHTIVKVCNPYCGPCAKAHPEIDALLENNEDIKVQVVFTATNDEGDKKAAPVRHLLAIAAQGDERLTKAALDDWYHAEVKGYARFAEKYPMNGELAMQHGKIEAMHQWCNQVGIQFTPTFFVNGYQLPDHYHLKDLHYLLKSG